MTRLPHVVLVLIAILLLWMVGTERTLGARSPPTLAFDPAISSAAFPSSASASDLVINEVNTT